jgi:Zn-dependent oligopeptidase
LLTNTSNGVQDMITAFRQCVEEYTAAGTDVEKQSQTTLGALEKQIQENAESFRNTVKSDMSAVTGYLDESNQAVAGSADTLINSYDSIIK